jgi:hypothetical protein
VTNYGLGATRMKLLRRSGLRPDRVMGVADRVLDERYPCHAVDDAGRALCGYDGPLTVIDPPTTWRDSSFVLNKCSRCTGEVERLDRPGQPPRA